MRPGRESPEKSACAEHIVNARIKEVYVGIEDPDPTVDRKGIKYLQDNGVTVHMFDREYQDEIRAANKDFIDQALERAAAAEVETPEPIKLSPLEDSSPGAEFDDFSITALGRFRKDAKIEAAIDSEVFKRQLALMGLVRERGSEFVPTGFGLILFGTSPRQHLPQAGLLGTIEYAGGREETRDFDGPQLFAPEEALDWLRAKLPDPIDRTHARRRSANDSLFELTREGIANALVHRDYSLKGAKCQLIASSDSITVKSPGRLLPEISLEQMQSFSAPMLSRNPILHYVFSRVGFAEERGLGLKSMRERATQAGLPLPTYSWEPPYLVLRVFLTSKSVVDPAVLARLGKAELAGWEWLATQETVTSRQYCEAMKLADRTGSHHLKLFTDLGLLERTGSGRATIYRVRRDSRQGSRQVGGKVAPDRS